MFKRWVLLVASVWFALAGQAFGQGVIVSAASDPVVWDESKATVCYLPHIAFGGDWESTAVADNLGEYGTNVQLHFRNQLGQPWMLVKGESGDYPSTIFGLSANSSASFVLPRTMSPNLNVGYIKVLIFKTLSGRDSANVSLSYSNTAGGKQQGEAAVPCVEPAYGFGFKGLVDLHPDSQEDDRQVGFAIVNPGTERAPVTVNKRNALGQVVDSVQFELEPGEQSARFLSQLKDGWGTGYEGLVQVISPKAIAVMGLKTTAAKDGRFLYSTLEVNVIPGMEVPD